MSYQPYRSPFGDTTLTKVFVGGLAWETQTDAMRRHFEQFGEILEAVIIKDKNTGKSKGYGFVTFRRAESARRACADPNPIIDGRRANCNIASMGRTRPPTPRGRIQGGNPYQGGSVPQGASSSYRGVPVGIPPPPPPPPPPPLPVLYPPYGYPTYSPDYGYPQSIYYPQLQQPQYFHQQLHGVSPSATLGSPYFYGYNNDPAQAASRGTAPQAQSIQGPPYRLYYPRQMEGSFTYPSLALPPPLPIQPSQPSLSTRHSTDLQPPQHTSTETEVGAVTSESPET